MCTAYLDLLIRLPPRSKAALGPPARAVPKGRTFSMKGEMYNPENPEYTVIFDVESAKGALGSAHMKLKKYASSIADRIRGLARGVGRRKSPANGSPTGSSRPSAGFLRTLIFFLFSKNDTPGMFSVTVAWQSCAEPQRRRNDRDAAMSHMYSDGVGILGAVRSSNPLPGAPTQEKRGAGRMNPSSSPRNKSSPIFEEHSLKV